MAEDVQIASDHLREFMFSAVYTNKIVKAEERKAQEMLMRLYEYYLKHDSELPEVYRDNIDRDGLSACAADYVAGMTDRYAIEMFEKIFIPVSWGK